MKIDFLKHIDKGKTHYSYGSGRKSDRTMKQILKDEKYTDKEIKRLHEENRILIRPHSLCRKLKSTEELYIVPDSVGAGPQAEVEDNSLDRFKDL